MGQTQRLYKKAKNLIPGGTQLLSKRPEMFSPDNWPAYYKKAKGCQIWDLDDKKYTDMSLMGIGSCILGYADADVDRAVKKAIDSASMTTLNCPEEVDLARKLCTLHPWADMAKFARTGGEAMVLAVRIARARTKRDIILFCGYHGWHDWYLAANLSDKRSLDGHLLAGLSPLGVVHSLKGTALPFSYNDTDSFLDLIKRYKSRIAAVIMEPVRNRYPEKGFLETVKEKTKKLKAILIYDEITSGWRLGPGGAHLEFKVYPDIAVFAKGVSNGYPMAAVIGRRNIMETAQDTFISSTYWTERIGPAAALAAISKMHNEKVYKHLGSAGRQVQEGWKRIAKKYSLALKAGGIYPLSHFSFEYKNTLALKTLFTQMMLEKGYLASTQFYASYAHKKNHISGYLDTVENVFYDISKTIKKGTVEKSLKGPVCHNGFKRLS